MAFYSNEYFKKKNYNENLYVFVCAGIRSVSFYEHIVTVGTGQGSLLFYDIRAHRFLENPLNPAGGYRKCPGDGILKLTTGKGWLVIQSFG